MILRAIGLAKSNEELASEFKGKLEADDRAQAEVAKRYNVRDACRRSSEIRSVIDETLGEVRFGVLSISEYADLKLGEIPDEQVRLRKIVHAMLKKADPELTMENVDALPFDDFTILTGILGAAMPGFLRLAKQASATGLKQAGKPSKSG